MKLKSALVFGASLLGGLSLLAQPTPQNAVTVVWKLSPSSNIVSQTVWWGQTTNYDKSFNVPPQASSYQIGGLLAATTYHVAIQCTQGVGTSLTNYVKSLYSGDLIYTTSPTDKPAPPGAPMANYPVMPNPPPPNVVNIKWVPSTATNVLSQTIWWGMAVGNYGASMNVPPQATEAQIAGLAPGTSYHIAINCTQGIGSGMTNHIQSNMSGELVYTTPPTARPEAPGTPGVSSVP